MFKMGSHDPFGNLKHKLWPKKRSRVKLPIWLATIKSRESPRFHRVQMVCDILLENSWQGLQFCFRSHLNRSLHAKLWAHKIMGVPVVKMLGLPLGNPETKCHLDVGLVEKYKVYYKGEGGGFSQVQAMVSLVSLNLLVAHSNTKSAASM